jgi:ATP-dependent RNA circularization protein (DNA/RNA ligase family)
MNQQRYKYPRTPHLNFSAGVGGDDLKLDSDRIFINRHVVVTEKLDGENTTLYSDYIHARSLDSGHHPSRAWVKALHASIRSDIPPGWRICGENVYAQHSIVYYQLKSYFYMFSIWNEQNQCLSWADTQEWAEILGLELPPVLYEGIWNKDKIISLVGSLNLDSCEGLVVRNSEQFNFSDFSYNVAKWVRSNHVQTDGAYKLCPSRAESAPHEHWMLREVISNHLLNS